MVLIQSVVKHAIRAILDHAIVLRKDFTETHWKSFVINYQLVFLFLFSACLLLIIRHLGNVLWIVGRLRSHQSLLLHVNALRKDFLFKFLKTHDVILCEGSIDKSWNANLRVVSVSDAVIIYVLFQELSHVVSNWDLSLRGR